MVRLLIIISFMLFYVECGNFTCNYTYVPSATGCDVCGNVSYTQNARIVGGSVAVAYSWPAQVYVLGELSETFSIPKASYPFYTLYQYLNTFSCGGTILNQYTILTAVHCIQTTYTVTVGGISYKFNVSNPLKASQFSVFVGAFDKANLNSAPTVKMSVWKVIKHPDYNVAYWNDIAILQLSKPIEFNQYVQPACLPNPAYGSYPPLNASAFASGWGYLSEFGARSSQLFNVKLTTYATSYCQYVSFFLMKDWNLQFCAGEYAGGKDTCQGDSGGGLYVYDTQISKYVVAGIVSYGDGCGRVNTAGIYTRVSYYYDWIQQNMAVTGDATKISSYLIFKMLLILIIFIIIY